MAFNVLAKQWVGVYDQRSYGSISKSITGE
jgi:hypothetical protein